MRNIPIIINLNNFALPGEYSMQVFTVPFMMHMNLGEFSIIFYSFFIPVQNEYCDDDEPKKFYDVPLIGANYSKKYTI